ncbi:uncharacterized protein BDW47DRAFT_108633 [Aspergillus candidus]|uniref:Uncharacterized protein n=1 Tax=Aspergillus candidus TaxID=41067 RepID=A0A2I2F751_ASPCN|nr:hypothetical protein BDW47DRAFT_108633 [Aspergillus candidus]PLB36455.1 hypothetical protein BDW47DRAFT_108633 [Aspergillus candidus]
MPSPVAKGLVITVSALVAAGIAVYESPQFRQWVDNSRRKIAVALHNLGDEIQPRNATSPARQDISMTEEVGTAAEERRRMAREDLERRRSLLEHRTRKERAGPGSFDALVDDDGRLLHEGGPAMDSSSLANSTAVEPAGSQSITQRGVGRPKDTLIPVEGAESSKPVETVPGQDGLHLDIPSPQNFRSSPVEYTPTSDGPEPDLYAKGLQTHSQPGSPSSHTVDFSPMIYPHHETSANDTERGLRSPFSDLSEMDPAAFRRDDRPATPSTTGSFSQIYESAIDDMTSDGTISDLGRSTGGIATPASWSEIGSVISQDDIPHQQ